jgi:phosphatidate cytidylyltransferase
LSKNLALRLLVAAVGIPLLIVISFLGGIYLLVLCILLVGLGGYELAAMFRKQGYYINFWLAVGLPVFCLLWAYSGSPMLHLLLVSFFIITSVLVIRYLRAAENKLADFPVILLGNLLPVIYLGLLGSCIIYLGKYPVHGGLFIIFIFLVVWGTDTAAYFGGRALGKIKLAEAISPNKTVAGFYWGFLGALTAAVVSRLIFLKIGWDKIIVMSLVACFFGQIGDLFESALKRHCGVKDSSAIIPGHGGVLDRFDSFFFAVPAVYLITVYWK